MLFSYQKNDFSAVLDDIFFKIICEKIDLFWIMALHFTKHKSWHSAESIRCSIPTKKIVSYSVSVFFVAPLSSLRGRSLPSTMKPDENFRAK